MTAPEDTNNELDRMAQVKANAQPDHGVPGLSEKDATYLLRLIDLSPGHDDPDPCEKQSDCACSPAADTPSGAYGARGWLIDNPCGQVQSVLLRVEADRIRNARRYEYYTPEPGFREEVLRDFLLLYAAGHMGRMSAWHTLLKKLNVRGEERARLVEQVLRSLNGVEAPAFLRWPHGEKHPRMIAKGTVCEGKRCGGRAHADTEQMVAVFDADFSASVAKDGIYAVPHRGRNAHRAVMEIDNKPLSGFGARLGASAYEKLGKQPGPDAIGALAALIRGRVLRDLDDRQALPPVLPVRSTPYRDGYLIDIGTAGKFVFVNAEKWWVVDWQPDFPTMLACERPLPIPKKPKGEDPRLRHLGFHEHEQNWHQIRMWQATAFCADHERQMMLLTGDSGSGKTKRAESIAWIIDPLEVDSNDNPVMGGPLPEDEALGPMLLRNYLFTSDNLSAMTHEDSDRLCRIATGYNFTRRVLYSTADLYSVTVRRPGLLTGIEVPTGLAEDAQNRMLHLHLDSNAAKRPSEEIARERHELGPQMLGALLDDMVAVLKAYRDGQYNREDRFPIVACAAQTFGPEYIATREAGKSELARTRASGDTLLAAVAKIVKHAGINRVDEATKKDTRVLDLTGSELLDALMVSLPPGTPRPKSWPTSAQGLTRRFRTNKDTVKAFGLGIEDIRTEKERRQRLTYVVDAETVDIPEPPDPDREDEKMYPDDRRRVCGPFMGVSAESQWERVRVRTEERIR